MKQVETAIAEYQNWYRRAHPSHEGTVPPRVLVDDAGSLCLRRPFKRGGRYFVKLAGTALLTAPHAVGEHGDIAFTPVWDWNDDR